MNLEDYSTPWQPTATWYLVIECCQEVGNPHMVLMEATWRLSVEGATPKVINLLWKVASEGHKLACYFLAIIYHAAIEKMFRHQATKMICSLRIQLGRKEMRVLTRKAEGWLRCHLRYEGMIFHADDYLSCPCGYNPPFMADRWRKSKKISLCKTCYINRVFKHLYEHMLRLWPDLDALFHF